MTQAPDAMSANSQSKRPEQLPALTTLRFVAAAYVLMFHFSAVAGSIFDVPLARYGYSGVTFFFILSGFILAYNYCDADFRSPAVRNRFYAARFSRVYPVFVLSLLAGLPFLLANLIKQEPGLMRTLSAGSMVVAPAGLQAWLPGTSCALNCPAWSISAELFFYALFPLLLAPVLARPGRWATLTLAGWVVIVAAQWHLWHGVSPGGSIMANHAGTAQELTAQFIKYFPPGRLPEFILGIVLYAFWRRTEVRPSTTLALSGAAAALLLSIAADIPDVLLHNGLTALVWAPLILGAAGLRRGALCSPAGIFLGRMSFSMYLLHLPLFNAALAIDSKLFAKTLSGTFPTAFVLTCTAVVLLAAACVLVFYEEPLRRRLANWAKGAAALTPRLAP